ncbi:NADP-dependent 3-hydroxy acid dehydrogenase YdfG [Sphingobium sp. AP50]|uniref:SDR family oxidoreductase n=1 Tax=Sphingobium sp. AP50 TaxID=1884369 RepID=UPI0008C8D6AA|nr:SDR family oxidoreductase [Sphingobium sp. AP50]SEK01451.1 NADP-dependent 3-hydroxy acid dehydrogenase YdfG [Sphingobium sp. AP50]
MTGRVAVITGAGSGIGRAAAIALAQRGYRLALAGRRMEALADSRALLGADVEALLIPTDVTDAASVRALFDQSVAAFGWVDLLFNNAGVNVPDVAIDDLAEADWRHIIDTNLTGAFLCLQAAFRVMKAQSPQGGRIINNGSISAHSPRPDSIAYTASKHAVTGLTKSTALDGRAYGIACCQIDIGNASSAMGDRMQHGVRQAHGALMAEPVMDVAQVGEAIAYMDSLPLGANVQFMTLMATNMPFIGRG